MNRHLLAGASALALLAGASAANAQFTVTVAGDVVVDFGYSSVNETKAQATGATNVPNARNTDFVQRARLVFTATQKTDSGLSYGGQTRVRLGPGRTVANETSGNAVGARSSYAGAGNDIDYDRAFIFLNGGFGQIVVGHNYGIFDNSNVAADAWGTGGSDGIFGNFIGGYARSPNGLVPAGAAANIFTGTNSPTFKTLLGSGDADSRVYYVTPDFSGFKAGVGYMPTNGGNNDGRVAQFDPNLVDFTDVVEAVVTYTETFDPVKVELVAGYTFGSGKPGAAGTATEDLTAYGVSGRFTFGPAAISLHYQNQGQSGQVKNAIAKADQSSFSVYGQYTVLPELTLGASYAVYTAAGSTAVAGEREMTVWALGAAYTVAPGLTLRPEYVNYKFDDKEGTNRDTDGNVFVLRTQVVF